ncbi:MAG TPA: AMP-binding protein, partial [Rhodopila sp.]
MTVFETFAEACRIYPDRPWLSVASETAAAYGIEAGDIRYGQAFERVLRLRAAYADAGYGAGHRVGLLLENRPAFFQHWLALNALGCSIVPLNPDLRIMELSYIISHSELVAIVALPSRSVSLREAAGGRSVSIVGPDDAPAWAEARGSARDEAALLYTSGTTGRPKGCVLPNEYFMVAGRWYARLTGLGTMHPGVERMLTPLPLFHMNALAFSAMAMLMTGGCLIQLDRFHPRSWWHTVRESRASIVHYLGVMPAILMADPPNPADRDHQVRFGFGAGVDAKLHEPFETRFGFPLIEAWAMTETGAGAVVAANEEPRHVGTYCFGRPGANVECRIAGEDQGELLVRHAGENPRFGFFREYLKDPNATAEAWDGGWFHTGDVVRRGPDGSL